MLLGCFSTSLARAPLGIQIHKFVTYVAVEPHYFCECQSATWTYGTQLSATCQSDHNVTTESRAGNWWRKLERGKDVEMRHYVRTNLSVSQSRLPRHFVPVVIRSDCKLTPSRTWCQPLPKYTLPARPSEAKRGGSRRRTTKLSKVKTKWRCIGRNHMEWRLQTREGKTLERGGVRDEEKLCRAFCNEGASRPPRPPRFLFLRIKADVTRNLLPNYNMYIYIYVYVCCCVWCVRFLFQRRLLLKASHESRRCCKD